MKILIAVDGSEHSIKALKEVLRLTGGGKIEEITLLHVFEGLLTGPIFNSDLDEEQARNLDNQLQKRGAAILEQSAGIFSDQDYTVNTVVKQGPIAQTIVQYAAEGNYDFIVVGSRGLSGAKKLFLGSVSNAIVQEAHTDVLVVK